MQHMTAYVALLCSIRLFTAADNITCLSLQISVLFEQIAFATFLHAGDKEFALTVVTDVSSVKDCISLRPRHRPHTEPYS